MGAKTELRLLGCQVFTEDCELLIPVRREAYDVAVYEVEVGKYYFIACLSGVERVLVTKNKIITLEYKPPGYMLDYCRDKVDEHFLSKRRNNI